MRFLFQLLIISFCFISCGPPQFEKNIRIIVKGIVVDENDNPIPNLNVSIYTERGSVFGANKEFLLGSGLSNSQGVFNVNSFFDQNKGFQVEVNGDELFSNYFYQLDTHKYVPEDLTFNLNSVKLNRLSTVNFNIDKTSMEDNNLGFSFRFKDTNCVEVFNEDEIDITQSRCLEFTYLNTLLNKDSPEIASKFETLLGSTVEFTYRLNDEEEITNTFIVDKINYEFNFSY